MAIWVRTNELGLPQNLMQCSHHPRSELCVSDFIHEIKTSFLLLTVLISLVSTYLQSNVTPAEKWV